MLWVCDCVATAAARNVPVVHGIKQDAHETWRKLQQELAKDSCSEDSDADVPSDEDWQEVHCQPGGGGCLFAFADDARLLHCPLR